MIISRCPLRVSELTLLLEFGPVVVVGSPSGSLLDDQSKRKQLDKVTIIFFLLVHLNNFQALNKHFFLFTLNCSAVAGGLLITIVAKQKLDLV